MFSSILKRILPAFLLSPLFIFQVDVLAADTQNVVANHVDDICARLQSGESPESLFSISLENLPDNEVHAKLLDPVKRIPNGNREKLGSYIGTLAFARAVAPFFKIAHTATAYRDESKFIPGILSTKILQQNRSSKGEEIILLEREREIPLALRAILRGASRYLLKNKVTLKEDSWLLVRTQVSVSENQGKGFLKTLEAFEYYKKLPDGKTMILMAGMALPAASFLSKKASVSEKVPKPLSKATFGVLNKVVSAMDVRDRLHFELSKAAVEGLYQEAVSLIQVTTDPRWSSRWVYQLTGEDSKEILDGNKSILEKAKKNHWIDYEFS